MNTSVFFNIVKRFFAKIKVKFFILGIVFGFLNVTVMANPPLATEQQIGMFKNSTLCVVNDEGNMIFSALVKEAVENHWKSTTYEFITQDEFNQRRFDSKYSFLMVTKGVFDKDPGGISYNYLSLVLGNKSSDMTNMPEFCSFPISYSDDNSMNFGYAIPAMIKFMQKHVANLESSRLMISLRGLKYYNSSSGFKDKVLLLNKNKLAENANTPEKIKTAYNYYVKLLSSEEIQTELASNPINALFNFHVGPATDNGSGKCFEMIFDVSGNLYYYNYRDITNENKDGFNLDDLKQL
jgi:hypothetical protein